MLQAVRKADVSHPPTLPHSHTLTDEPLMTEETIEHVTKVVAQVSALREGLGMGVDV